MSQYFVIRTNEDGDVHIDVLSKEELEHRLNENPPYYGHYPIVSGIVLGSMDLLERAQTIILKGELVTPRAAERVTKWEV